MFGLALRRKGYYVIDADSGAAALALARQYLPTLILTDIHMPGGDGSYAAEAARISRRDPSTCYGPSARSIFVDAHYPGFLVIAGPSEVTANAKPDRIQASSDRSTAKQQARTAWD